MLIKHKLLANTGILVVALLFMLGLITYAVSELEDDIEVARLIGNIESDVLQLRRNEKDFLARKDLKYQERFGKNFSGLMANVNELEQKFDGVEPQASSIKKAKKVLNDYKGSFNALVEAQKVIGLNPKDGLYGELRGAVHSVEELLEDSDYKLLSNMLQLRRNEKDFMLRLDEKYLTQWLANSDKFIENVNSSELADTAKEDVTRNIGVYRDSFQKLVAAQKELGFKSDQGLLGEMRETIHQTDQIVNALIKSSKEGVEANTSFVETASYGVFFIVLAISLSFAIFVSKSILTGITQLQGTMNNIAKTKDLSLTIDTNAKDELGDVARVFDMMITSFRNLIVEVNHSVETVNEATQNLTQTIHQSNEGVDIQIQETDLVATAVTQMVATVDEIANNTQDAADKADATNKNAIEGKGGVDATIETIDQLSSKLLESEDVVQELAKDSETIGSVLDVIRGIAEQTNLLALNAAIEAARAGEQGRGFAVVADEVRTLASRTQDSTQEIEGIINSLQSRTKDIVAHMAACRTQGQESAEKASSAGAMLEQITEDVSVIMDMNTAIATAIQEQSAVASEVNQHVVKIRDVTEQSGQSSIQIGHMSEELAAQADVLNKEVNQFKV